MENYLWKSLVMKLINWGPGDLGGHAKASRVNQPAEYIAQLYELRPYALLSASYKLR